MKHLVFIILISVACKNIYAQVYSYPVKPGTETWKKLITHDEMVKVCQVPDDVIQQMNTNDLLATCLQYPLLFDMYAYDNLKIGFDEMSKKFNGFSSLKERRDAGKIIMEEYKKINAATIATLKSQEEKGRFTLLLSAIEILIANDDILNQLEPADRKMLLKEILKKNQDKERYKEAFGTLGTLTLLYTGSKTLDIVDDPIWKLYVTSNKNAKLFSDKMMLSDQNVLNSILLNIQRILNK